MLFRRLSALAVISILLLIQIGIELGIAGETSSSATYSWVANEFDKSDIQRFTITAPTLEENEVLSNRNSVTFTIELAKNVKSDSPVRVTIYKKEPKNTEPSVLAEPDTIKAVDHLAQIDLDLKECDEDFFGEDAYSEVVVNPGSKDEFKRDFPAPNVIVNFRATKGTCLPEDHDEDHKYVTILNVLTIALEKIDVRLKILINEKPQSKKPKNIPESYSSVGIETNLTWEDVARKFGKCPCDDGTTVEVEPHAYTQDS